MGTPATRADRSFAALSRRPSPARLSQVVLTVTRTEAAGLVGGEIHIGKLAESVLFGYRHAVEPPDVVLRAIEVAAAARCISVLLSLLSQRASAVATTARCEEWNSNGSVVRHNPCHTPGLRLA